jgi:DNA-binding NarL/FixJ family response regulator
MFIRCYVADMDPFARRLLCDVIARDPETVLVGVTGEERAVLHDVQRLRPDVAFVEMAMSGAIVRAKETSGAPTPYCLVLVSALASDESDALACDATGFMRKPCSRAQVAAVLEHVRRRMRERRTRSGEKLANAIV